MAKVSTLSWSVVGTDFTNARELNFKHKVYRSYVAKIVLLLFCDFFAVEEEGRREEKK